MAANESLVANRLSPVSWPYLPTTDEPGATREKLTARDTAIHGDAWSPMGVASTTVVDSHTVTTAELIS